MEDNELVHGTTGEKTAVIYFCRDVEARDRKEPFHRYALSL